MKRIYIIVICQLFLLSIFPQNIKKGFKQLEKSDYAKAKDFFDQELRLSGESPAAHFGLMVLFADENSPYHNLVEAWSSAGIVDRNIGNLSQDEKEIIADYFVNTEVRRSSWPVNKKMMQAVGAVEAKLIKYIREENNLGLTYDVIKKFPDFRYYNNVIHIRNQLEFRKYEKQNTLEGYLEFINKFPDAAQIDKAVRYRNKLAFEKAKSINTVDAYEDYMKRYPEAFDFGNAIKLRNAAAFSLAKQKNSVEAFEYFINKYHDALEIADAKRIQQQLLYDYARKIQTLEAYNEFIAKYPEGSRYIDIFNLKSLDLGMKFFSTSGLNWNNVEWCRSFDNKMFPEDAAGLALTSANNYVVAGNTLQNDSVYRDAWIIMLDENGKMIWNKIIGGMYHDSIFTIKLNGAQDIIALGYTWLTPANESKEGWIFKLDKEGRKIWNRSLGKWNITSLTVNSANDIFIGGYDQNDSLGNKYRLMVINNNGMKLWERTYTSSGAITGMLTGLDDNIVVGGSEWIFKMTPKGYIIWEHPCVINDSISCIARLPDGSILLGGLRDTTKRFISALDSKGMKMWEKMNTNDEMALLKHIQTLGPSGYLGYLASPFSEMLAYYYPEGDERKKLMIPGGLYIKSYLIDGRGNLMILLTTEGNINLLKNSGTDL
jgi:tetratricopeptide (TPR) repeat protein